MKAGATIEARLSEACDGDPTPERILALPNERLRACGMSNRKAQSLRGLAQYACDNDLDELASLPDEEIRSRLTSLSGVGAWTCDMFLLFYLDRPDILPVEDGAVRQSFAWLYGAPITDSEVREAICTLWHPYASTAVRYLYRALNTGLVKQGPSREVLGW